MAKTDDRPWLDELEIENAEIKWAFSRFDGRADAFHEEGDIDFVVMFDQEEADRLRDLGWNVKEKMPREEGDLPEHHLTVKISYRFDPPTIYFIKSGRKYSIDNAAELKQIKRSTCERADLIIQPSFWSRPTGDSGYTAYLKEGYFTIAESRFGAKYNDEDYEPVN